MTPRRRSSDQQLASCKRGMRPGQWCVRRGSLAPYHVVDPLQKTLIPQHVRRLLLARALERQGLTPVEAIRHINAVRNYLKNKTSSRQVAIRRAYTSDIRWLQSWPTSD